VNTEECNYILHAPAGAATATGEVDIECPTGQSIKISQLTFKVEVDAQQGLKELFYANSGNNVIVTPKIGGITVTKTEDGSSAR
jgi:hypothetical protein